MTTELDSRPEPPDDAPGEPGRFVAPDGSNPYRPPGFDGLLPRAPWRVWQGLAALPVGIVIASIAGLFVFGIAAATGADVDDPPPAANLAATLLQDAAFIGAALVLARVIAYPRRELFGLVRPRGWSALGWTAAAYGALLVCGVVIGLIFGTDQQDQEEVLDSLGLDRGWGYVAAAGFLVTVAAPLAEEFLFRGFIFQSFRQRIGAIWGAVASGTMFGAVHITNYEGDGFEVLAASVLTLALFGVLLALLVAKTGSLLPAIGLHAFNNCFAFGQLQDWDWQIAPLMVASLTLTLGLGALAIRHWPTPRDELALPPDPRGRVAAP
ncbi:MAG TPA: type II CAAX endopeptidase family protein [Solirubrobacteraceae bacterium]|nr:type II CAAX endopeptidase family protein [Solirubrobacteraceae bacterium]